MSLFADTHVPLAEHLRPRTLDEVIGQQHLLGPGGFVRVMVEKNEPTSLILWGPPGTGKTTLARIIADSSKAAFEELSAVTSGIADVKKVIERAKERKHMGAATVLFVDEIHRFNKSQQDAFLPHVENGTITLIGATTENPSFEVISPLLSRSRVLVLQSLKQEELELVVKRGVRELPGVTINKDATKLLAQLSAGDARMAIGGLEVASQLSKKITIEIVKTAMQKQGLRYDKNGEFHYNLISAFIKSMRGSDPDAAVYYLARMLDAGEDPKFIARRIVIFASEDIGLAHNTALAIAVAAFQAVERIGLPEGRITLAHAAIAMAIAPKSRAAYDAIGAASMAVSDNPGLEPPTHLRNAPTKLMKDLGYGKDTKWEAGFDHPKGFLPEELKGRKFYNEEK